MEFNCDTKLVTAPISILYRSQQFNVERLVSAKHFYVWILHRTIIFHALSPFCTSDSAEITCVSQIAKSGRRLGRSTLLQKGCLSLLIKKINLWRCPLCNGYRRRKWTQRLKFKSWTRMIAFSHSTNTLGKGMNPIILPPAMGK